MTPPGMGPPTATPTHRPRPKGWRRRCGAHAKATGEPCGKWALSGLTVCRAHGGAANRERGLRVLEGERVRQRAGAAIVALGLERDTETDPIAVLLDQLTQAAVTERALARLLEAAPSLEDATGQRPSVLVELWNAERDRAARFAESAIRAGIAERVVRMTEVQGVRIVDAVTAALRDPAWELTESQRETGQRIIARHFRAAVR